jgi:hypothetical protein
VPADPETTAIVTGMAEQEGEQRRFSFTLAALWNAVPEESGVWRLEDGSVLTLLSADVASKVTKVSEALATS